MVPPSTALCLFTIFVLVKCLRGVLGEALPGQGRHSPGPVLFSFPRAAGATGSQGVGGQRSGCHLPWNLCPLWAPSSVIEEAAGDLTAGWKMRNVSLSTPGGIFPTSDLLLPFRDHNDSTLPPAQSRHLLVLGMAVCREPRSKGAGYRRDNPQNTYSIQPLHTPLCSPSLLAQSLCFF